MQNVIANPKGADHTRAKPMVNEYLSFRVGAEEYGIDILKVQEIRGYEAPTRMVNTPPFILGVQNLRGVIVPILDLRIQFGLPHVAYRTETVTIVLNIGAVVLGVVVDAVSDVVALAQSDIKDTPELGRDQNSDFVVGIATVQQGDERRMLILMDIEKLMSGQDIGLLERLAQ